MKVPNSSHQCDVPTQTSKASRHHHGHRRARALGNRRLRPQRSLLLCEVHRMTACMRRLRRRLPQNQHHRSLDGRLQRSVWWASPVRSPSKATHLPHHLRIVLHRHSPTTVRNLSMTAATRAMPAWPAISCTPSTTTCQLGRLRISRPQTTPASALAQTKAVLGRPLLHHLLPVAILRAPQHPTWVAKPPQHGNTHRLSRIARK